MPAWAPADYGSCFHVRQVAGDLFYKEETPGF